MRRCKDGCLARDARGWPKQREVLGYSGNASYDSVGYLLYPIDLPKLRKFRTRQLVELGRYAHQPISIWQDMSTRDFDSYYSALADILDAEKPDTSEEFHE